MSFHWQNPARVKKLWLPGARLLAQSADVKPHSGARLGLTGSAGFVEPAEPLGQRLDPKREDCSAAWSAAGVPPMLTICVLRNRQRWVATAATSLRSRSVVGIIARCIAAATKPPGGKRPLSVLPSPLDHCGCRHIRFCELTPLLGSVGKSQNYQTKPIWKAVPNDLV
jgi:hypothetical protein